MDNAVKKLYRCVVQIKLKADFKGGHILRRELPQKKNNMVSSLLCLQSKVFILMDYGEQFDHSGEKWWGALFSQGGNAAYLKCTTAALPLLLQNTPLPVCKRIISDQEDLADIRQFDQQMQNHWLSSKEKWQHQSSQQMFDSQVTESAMTSMTPVHCGKLEMVISVATFI